MNSVIVDLYNGDLCPCEQFKPILRKYREKQEEAFRGYESFCRKLDEEKLKEFEEIMERHLDLVSLEMEQVFSDGFKLGVKMMCEVFMQDDVEKYLEVLEKAGKTE